MRFKNFRFQNYKKTNCIYSVTNSVSFFVVFIIFTFIIFTTSQTFVVFKQKRKFLDIHCIYY